MKKSIFLTAILIAALGFTGCGGFDKNGGDLKIDAKVLHGDLLNNQVDEVWAKGYIDLGGGNHEEIVIATALFRNGGFKMTLPKTFDERLLEPMDLEGMVAGVPNLTVSNKNVNGTQLQAFYASKNYSDVGAFLFYCMDMTDTGQSLFMFVDGDCNISGSHTEPIGSSGKYELIIDMNLKEGWNIFYVTSMQAGNIVRAKYTTKKPEVDFKWYFMGGGPMAPPKDAKPFNFFKKNFD